MVVLLGGLGLRVVPAAVGRLREARELLDARRTLLDRIRTDLAGLDALGDSTTALRARVVALAPRILSGTSAAEAMNDLVGRVTLATDRGAVKLTGTEPLPDSSRAGVLRRVGLRASFEGDVRGVVGTLRALEQDPGALLLDDLRVLALDPASAETVPELLRVELSVWGWQQAKAAGS
jgi:hypothetical protein